MTRLLPFLLLLCAACGTPERLPSSSAQQDTTQRRQVLSLIEKADTSGFRSAFANLGQYYFTRYERTEQRGDGEAALRARTVRYAPEGALLLREDSAGTFERGMFDFLAGSPAAFADDDAIASAVLPAEPPYLTARHFDAFRYTLRGDTLLAGRVALYAEIEAVPGEGDNQSLRRVRYYVDRQTNALIAVSLHRADEALLFAEATSLYLQTRATSQGDRVPAVARFSTSVKLPLQGTRHLSRVSTYYGLVPKEP